MTRNKSIAALLLSISFILVFILNRSVYKVAGLEWLIGMIVVAAFCVRWLSQGIEKYTVMAILPSFFLIVWFLSSSGYHHYIDFHLTNLTTVVVVWSIAYVFAYAYVNDHMHELEKTALFVWFFITLLFLLATALGAYEYRDGQFSAHYKNRNNYAVATCVLLYLYLISNKKATAVSVLVIVFLSSIVIYTKSITGVAFLIVVGVAYSLRKSLVTKLIFGLSFIFLSLTIYFTFDDFSERINAAYYSITDPSKVHVASSGRARLYIATKGLEIFNEHPIVGVGVHNSKEFIKPDFGTGRYDGHTGYDTHNNYLELAISGGVIALILFYLPLFLSSLLFLMRREYELLLGCVALFLIGFVTRLFEFFPLMFLYYFLILKSLKFKR